MLQGSVSQRPTNSVRLRAWQMEAGGPTKNVPRKRKRMAEAKQPGRARRLTDKTASMMRFLRRAYHERSGAQRLDVSQIEQRMLCSLYRKAAAELGLDAYEIGQALCIAGGGKRFRIWGCSTDLDTCPLYMITEDKLLIKSLFREHGIAVPEGRAFDWRDQSAGVDYALSLGRPCVTKPASQTSSGKGVATLLTTRSDIARAFRFAGLFAPQVLVEEFISGDNYRFLIYKGKCLSVLRRELPTVTGNGASTVLELAEAENRKRIQSSDWREGDALRIPMAVNAAASRHLKRQGLDLKSVPGPDEQVHLAGASNYGFGCTYTEVLAKTHPEQIRAAVEAAKFIGMTIAGVDIVSANIEAPNYHILEINVSPGLELHYMLRNPEEMKHPIRTILTDYFEIGETGSAAGRTVA
jgi:cyanophycin synthetase